MLLSLEAGSMKRLGFGGREKKAMKKKCGYKGVALPVMWLTGVGRIGRKWRVPKGRRELFKRTLPSKSRQLPETHGYVSGCRLLCETLGDLVSAQGKMEFTFQTHQTKMLCDLWKNRYEIFFHSWVIWVKSTLHSSDSDPQRMQISHLKHAWSLGA